METETLLAISAGVTFLLALAAFWAIWQNYHFSKRERRECLLNEIIEWAIEVTRINFGGEIEVKSGISERIQRRLDAVNRLLWCQVLAVKGKEVIEKFALSINRDLRDAVSQVTNSLVVVIDVLKRGTPYAESEEAKNILKSNDSIFEQNIRNLLNEASKHRIQ
jgi:hypothetical protein